MCGIAERAGAWGKRGATFALSRGMRTAAVLFTLAIVGASCAPTVDLQYEAYAYVANAANAPKAGVVVDIAVQRKGGEAFSASNFYTSGADGYAGPLRFGTKLRTNESVEVRATARNSGVTGTEVVTYDEARDADTEGTGALAVVVPLTVP